MVIKNIIVDALLESAIKKTKLFDWGDDKSFVQPLQILVDSFMENQLGPVEERLFRYECIRLLKNRLLIQNDFKENPEILHVPVNRPLFIIGLGRTGSTFLHHLFSTNNAARVLNFWELKRPSPPPDINTRQSDPRIAQAEKEVGAIYQRYPEFLVMHETQATTPEECCFLLFHTFMCRLFYIAWPVKTYIEWLMHQDLAPAYRYYKDLLKLLLYKTQGTPLILKDPSHLAALQIILNIFPDANFVWTHRDPVKAMASLLSLKKVYHNKMEDAGAEREIEQLAYDLQFAHEIRKHSDPSRFFDVAYHDLVNNPGEVLYKIYDYFHYPYPGKSDENLQEFINRNRSNKHGVHKYAIEDYGFSADGIKEIFSFYIQHYYNYLYAG